MPFAFSVNINHPYNKSFFHQRERRMSEQALLNIENALYYFHSLRSIRKLRSLVSFLMLLKELIKIVQRRRRVISELFFYCSISGKNNLRHGNKQFTPKCFARFLFTPWWVSEYWYSSTREYKSYARFSHARVICIHLLLYQADEVFLVNFSVNISTWIFFYAVFTSRKRYKRSTDFEWLNI